MHKRGIKEFLEREVPEVDCGRLKERVLARIAAHDRRQAQEGHYVIPRAGVMVLALLVGITIFDMMGEILRDVEGGAFTARGEAVRLVDNFIILSLLLYVGVCADRRFLGVYRVVRTVRAGLAAIWNLLVSIPALSLGIIKKRS